MTAGLYPWSSLGCTLRLARNFSRIIGEELTQLDWTEFALQVSGKTPEKARHHGRADKRKHIGGQSDSGADCPGHIKLCEYKNYPFMQGHCSGGATLFSRKGRYYTEMTEFIDLGNC